MIVILNSFHLPIAQPIAQQLAARYETGAWIDLHAMLDSDPAQPIIPPPDIPCDHLGRHVSSAKQQGKEHLVVNYSFETPEKLKQLRVCFSAYDDEIYAFRLRFSPDVFGKLIETLEQGKETAHAAYARWLEAQETGARYGDMGYEILVNSTDLTVTVNTIWDDIHAPVELVPYQEQWPEMFACERNQILDKLQGKILGVEHIGSTAIPGVSAKPVIDILITVEHLDDAVFCIQPLRELGYAFIDYPQNTDRRFFRKGTPRRFHIHIVAKDSTSVRNYIDFRDVLRADEALRHEYHQLKLDAMQQYKTRRARYGERKGMLIQKALRQFRVQKP